jgi:hypothetical protein
LLGLLEQLQDQLNLSLLQKSEAVGQSCERNYKILWAVTYHKNHRLPISILALGQTLIGRLLIFYPPFYSKNCKHAVSALLATNYTMNFPFKYATISAITDCATWTYSIAVFFDISQD